MGLCMLKYYASLTHLQGKLGKFLQRLSLPTAEVGDVDGIMVKRIQRLSCRSESRRAKERTLTRSDWHVISLTLTNCSVFLSSRRHPYPYLVLSLVSGLLLLKELQDETTPH